MTEAAAKKHFHCKDVGYECEWSLEGDSEEQMLPIIEDHALKVHNLTYFKGPAVDHVLEAIRKNV
jgi:predicted small metal-binding protein